MNILNTDRLVLRELILEDAPFILELLNEPAFLRFIGDRNVRDIASAQDYITKGPLANYARYGFGLWLVQKIDTQESLGICGLVKRENLPDVDIGYAFLARFRSQGYAFESAAAVKNHAVHSLGLKCLLGITDPANSMSIRVLEKIGLKFERLVILTESGPELMLFSAEYPILTSSGDGGSER